MLHSVQLAQLKHGYILHCMEQVLPQYITSSLFHKISNKEWLLDLPYHPKLTFHQLTTTMHALA